MTTSTFWVSFDEIRKLGQLRPVGHGFFSLNWSFSRALPKIFSVFDK